MSKGKRIYELRVELYKDNELIGRVGANGTKERWIELLDLLIKD